MNMGKNIRGKELYGFMFFNALSTPQVYIILKS